eukprot:gene2453-1789_t
MSWHVSTFELAKELLPRLAEILSLSFHLLLSSICWVIVLPIFTYYWMKLNWCFVSDLEPETCHRSVWRFVPTPQFLVNAWYWGVMDMTMIGVVTFFFYEIYRVVNKRIRKLRKHHRIAQLEHEVNERNRWIAELEQLAHAKLFELVEVLVHVVSVERIGAPYVFPTPSNVGAPQWDRVEQALLDRFADWRVQRQEIQAAPENQFVVDRRRLVIVGDGGAHRVIHHDLRFLRDLAQQWDAVQLQVSPADVRESLRQLLTVCVARLSTCEAMLARGTV